MQIAGIATPPRAIGTPLWAAIFREGIQCDISRACLLRVFPRQSVEGRGSALRDAGMLVGTGTPALMAKALLRVTLTYFFNSRSGPSSAIKIFQGRKKR